MVSVNRVLAVNSAIVTEQNVPFREMDICNYPGMLLFQRTTKSERLTYSPATMKLSVTFFRVPLRHITVDESLMIILDAVTCRVEVKLAFRGIPLTLMREILSRPRFRILGGISVAKYDVG